jgi:hypothetical protein
MGKPDTNGLIKTIIFKERHFHTEPYPTLDPTHVLAPDPVVVADLETKLNL